mgnify:CR=1 FL=1
MESQMTPKCSFCESEAVDSMVVECGNNAEYSIEINLCESHLKEEEATGYKFEEKYGDRIEQMNNERWY